VRIWGQVKHLNGQNSQTSEVSGPLVRLWVEDHGIGIAPEHQARIFEAFERLHGVDSYLGTGIGLAIVRRGISRIGGRVGVEAVPHRGSRFWIELPLAHVAVSGNRPLP
jgi:signal transduction histidine kinase